MPHPIRTRSPGAPALLLPLALGLLGCERAPASGAANAAEVASGGAGSVEAAPVPALPFYLSADLTAEWLERGSARYAQVPRIAPFSLRSQDGDTVTNASLRGKIYLANFFFTACQGVCPKMLKNLRALQEALAADPDVVLVSHSVTPSQDSVDVLRDYAQQNGIRSGRWLLLTGPKETIYDLARRSYFAEKRGGLQKSASEFLHTENMLLVDRQGRLRGVYNATLPVEAERALEDIRQLQRESDG